METRETQIDVRVLPKGDRHRNVLQAFDALEKGRSLLLLSDHDPKGLQYQFTVERPDAFGWEHLQSGPDEWRIRISKIGDQKAEGEGKSGGCCGCRCGAG